MTYTKSKLHDHIIPPLWLPATDIPKLLEYKENLVGIEIGSCFGCSTHYLLETLQNSIIHAVDPYEEYEQMTDRARAYNVFLQMMELYPNRIILHKKTSDDAITDFEQESIDFVFIDGLHTYEQVKKDIINYYPFLKKDGLLCGHDYIGWGAYERQKEVGVDTAVNEMALLYGKTVSFCEQDVWYWRK